MGSACPDAAGYGMRDMRPRFAILLFAAAVCGSAGAGASAPAAPAPAAPAPAWTPEQMKLLAIRAAQVNASSRLADRVLAARLADGRTVGAVLGPAGDGEVALRLVLRSARLIGDPRVYSDGVAEVDVEVALDAVVQKVGQLCGAKPDAKTDLPDLRAQAMDGYLRMEGRGRPPRDITPERVRKVEAARPDELPEMFPAGWERVTALGRVEAGSRARVQAYAALASQVRGLRLGSTRTLGELVAGAPVAESILDTYMRGLPVAGAPRMMPDRVAEVDVAAPVRDLIRVLKDVRAVAPADSRWPEDEVDQLSVNLKTDRLVATGHGMPLPDQVRPEEALPEAPAPPLPDWAAQVLEARGTAKPSEDIEDAAQAQLLAARAAKARAASDLERQLDAVRLDDGQTVRQRAAKDEVFRRDIRTLLESAKVARHQTIAEGRQWEVVLRLPLVRLWEFSRPREE